MEKYGKVSGSLFRTILRNLGKKKASIVIPPGIGLDNGVLSVDGKRVLIHTTDPISLIPLVGAEKSAWLSLHHLASDFTTSGIMPQYAIMNYNLPPFLADDQIERFVRSISQECKRLGIAIVGGHTGRYPGCDLTIIGSATLFGFADKDAYLTPKNAKVDDAILLTKGAAIESTAIFASSFQNYVKEKLGKRLWRKAIDYIQLCSTVKEAILASKNGATSLHDATEGGVIGALYELSAACGRRLRVDLQRIHIPEETKQICSLFGIDPLRSLSGGSLLITCREDDADKLQEKLKQQGIKSFRIGKVSADKARGSVIDKDGRKLVAVTEDPYWSAYSEAIKSGWTKF
ncbi:MAG: AIR synthase family protein [Conexivisphaerales archaeon]